MEGRFWRSAEYLCKPRRGKEYWVRAARAHPFCGAHFPPPAEKKHGVLKSSHQGVFREVGHSVSSGHYFVFGASVRPAIMEGRFRQPGICLEGGGFAVMPCTGWLQVDLQKKNSD